MSSDGWNEVGKGGKLQAKINQAAKRKQEKIEAHQDAFTDYRENHNDARQSWFNQEDRAGMGELNQAYHAFEKTAKANAKAGNLLKARSDLNSALELREQAAENYDGMDAGHQEHFDMLKARRNSISSALGKHDL